MSSSSSSLPISAPPKSSRRLSIPLVHYLLQRISAKMIPSSLVSSALSYILSFFKYSAILLLVINSHSLPLVWHARFWWRAIPANLGVWRIGRRRYLGHYMNSIQPKERINARVVSHRRALPDDCDFNLHLSNSCYAKSADLALCKWIWDMTTPGLMSGVGPALGGSHYSFVKEIPIMSRYSMESRVVGWGEKWLYSVTEFILPPKGSRSKGILSGSSIPAIISSSSPDTSPTSSPAATDIIPGVEQSNGEIKLGSSPTAGDIAAQALAGLRVARRRQDGATVVAVAVHEICFKLGRITVPPRIAFHASLHSPSASERQRAIDKLATPSSAKKWLSGGWRNEPDANDIGRDIVLDT